MRNTIVGWLLCLTAALFLSAILLPVHPLTAIKFYQVGFVSGVSAIFTKLLLKEDNNG